MWTVCVLRVPGRKLESLTPDQCEPNPHRKKLQPVCKETKKSSMKCANKKGKKKCREVGMEPREWRVNKGGTASYGSPEITPPPPVPSARLIHTFCGDCGDLFELILLFNERRPLAVRLPAVGFVTDARRTMPMNLEVAHGDGNDDNVCSHHTNSAPSVTCQRRLKYVKHHLLGNLKASFTVSQCCYANSELSDEHQCTFKCNKLQIYNTLGFSVQCIMCIL